MPVKCMRTTWYLESRTFVMLTCKYQYAAYSAACCITPRAMLLIRVLSVAAYTCGPYYPLRAATAGHVCSPPGVNL